MTKIKVRILATNVKGEDIGLEKKQDICEPKENGNNANCGKAFILALFSFLDDEVWYVDSQT
jgi:hypothetical protein